MYAREIVKDSPRLLALWQGTGLLDLSGYITAGSVNGTPANHLPLCNGASQSYIVTSSNNYSFTNVAAWRPGSENSPFTLEAWALPLKTDSNSNTVQQIVGNNTLMDGIVRNGTVISFIVKYANSSSCTVSYDIDTLRAIHVAAVYSIYKISLYINGELVGEAEPTSDQLAAGFASIDNNLYVGSTTSTTSTAVQAVAAYTEALEAPTIANHYASGSKHSPIEGAASDYGATLVNLSENLNDAFINRFWDTNIQWRYAKMRSVVAQNSRLLPAFDVNGNSLPGTWTTLVPFTTTATSIYMIVAHWEGTGFVIESSVNEGTTWSTVTQGMPIANVPAGTNPQSLNLYLRVTFNGGVFNDQSYVDKLNIVGFRTGALLTQGARPINLNTPAVARLPREIPELDDAGGTYLNNGGITIGPTTNTFSNSSDTLELLVKRQGSLTTNFAGIVYSNGVAATDLNAATPVGQWRLVHITRSTASNTSITISGDAVVHHVSLYPVMLNTVQMSDISNRYFGIPFFTTGDDSAVVVTEDTASYTIYANDWSIVQSG